MTRNQSWNVRRLPIVFMVEASAALDGTYGVALRQGLETIADKLAAVPVTERAVYLATIVFNQSVLVSQRLKQVGDYSAPDWQPTGTMALGPALDALRTLLQFGIIHGDASQPGDLPALIVLALGSHADDDWKPNLARVRNLPMMRQASVFALIVNRRESDQAKAVTPQVICLDSAGVGDRAAVTPAEIAERMTAFFDWMAQVAQAIVETSLQGSDPVALPPLPSGLVSVI